MAAKNAAEIDICNKLKTNATTSFESCNSCSGFFRMSNVPALIETLNCNWDARKTITVDCSIYSVMFSYIWRKTRKKQRVFVFPTSRFQFPTQNLLL